MKRLLILLLFPIKLFSQDISGVWTGTLFNDTLKAFIPYEIVISEFKGKLSGYSHTTFFIDGIPNIGVKALKINRNKDKIFLEDNGLLYSDYSVRPAKGVRQYSVLTLTGHDSLMVLSGGWMTNKTKLYSSATGRIIVQKRGNMEETKIVPQLVKLDLIKTLSFVAQPKVRVPFSKVPITRGASSLNVFPASDIKSRKIETIETVYFNSDSLVLSLYDNGEVDGDTVTVLMNGSVIWPRQGLTEKAINKTIYIPNNLDSIQLIMYAENLGSIPPNTGLLVVRDGGKDYEIRFSGDLKKNAAIVLRRRKPVIIR